MIAFRPASGWSYPGPDWVVMVPAAPLVASAFTGSDEISHRTVRLACRLTFRVPCRRTTSDTVTAAKIAKGRPPDVHTHDDRARQPQVTPARPQPILPRTGRSRRRH